MLAAFVQEGFMPASLSCQCSKRRDSLGTACWKASLIQCAMGGAGSATNLIKGLKRLILIGIKGY